MTEASPFFFRLFPAGVDSLGVLGVLATLLRGRLAGVEGPAGPFADDAFEISLILAILSLIALAVGRDSSSPAIMTVSDQVFSKVRFLFQLGEDRVTHATE